MRGQLCPLPSASVLRVSQLLTWGFAFLCIVTMLVMVSKELLWLPMWAGRSPSTKSFRRLEGLYHWFQFSNCLAEVLQLRGSTEAAIAEDGVATSMILSASWAKLSRLPVSGVEARTIRMFSGKHCRKVHIRRCCLHPRPCLPIAVAFFSRTVTVSYPLAPRHETIVASVSVLRQQCI